MPETASLQLKWTVTLPLYQPFVFGKLVAAALISGLLLSIMTVRESELLLPARSLQLEKTVIALPSPLEPLVWVQLLESIPEPESVQCQSTVTALVYQPLLPTVPLTTGASAGFVLSIATVTVLLGRLVLPALSVTDCAVEETAAPSVLSV